jgi:hypothetical protein
MKELFLLLFFAKSVVIAPEPIDIVGEVSFQLPEGIAAITSGAHVRIDVTRSLPGDIDNSNVIAVLDYLRAKYPGGSVTATLVADSGQETILDRVGGSAGGKGAELVLWTLSGVETGVDFSELIIETTKSLDDVTVVWRNHKK